VAEEQSTWQFLKGSIMQHMPGDPAAAALALHRLPVSSTKRLEILHRLPLTEEKLALLNASLPDGSVGSSLYSRGPVEQKLASREEAVEVRDTFRSRNDSEPVWNHVRTRPQTQSIFSGRDSKDECNAPSNTTQYNQGSALEMRLASIRHRHMGSENQNQNQNSTSFLDKHKQHQLIRGQSVQQSTQEMRMQLRSINRGF